MFSDKSSFKGITFLRRKIKFLYFAQNCNTITIFREIASCFKFCLIFRHECNYFEIEILSSSNNDAIIGLVPAKFNESDKIGDVADSIGYHLTQGIVSMFPFTSRFPLKTVEKCFPGDKIGCGIKFAPKSMSGKIFFTKNGTEVCSVSGRLPQTGLFPAVGMASKGDKVKLRLPGDPALSGYLNDEDIMMAVDTAEDEWHRLHDVRLNGPVLEYTGRGKCLVDVGLAQAKTPICTRNHYFEIEILNPGYSCYIAIGLARKDYPKHRHPGWNRGSIAYHADDGKVFVGSGRGAPFGPRCHKGDIMGCGVLFPRNYECKSDSEEELEQQGGSLGDVPVLSSYTQDVLRAYDDVGLKGGVIFQEDPQVANDLDSCEDDEWGNDKEYTQNGVKVQVNSSMFSRIIFDFNIYFFVRFILRETARWSGKKI